VASFAWKPTKYKKKPFKKQLEIGLR
jgi:hypothetical protein